MRRGEPDSPEMLTSLWPIGLNATEEAAYELMLGSPASTESELARSWTRGDDLGAVVSGLRAKGLLRVTGQSPPRYTALPPEIALGALILDQEQQLGRAREHARRLSALFHEHAADRHAGSDTELIEVVTGRTTIAQRLDQVRRATRREIRSLDKPPSVDHHGALATNSGGCSGDIASRAIYDRASVEEPHGLSAIEALVRAGQQARTLPELPLKLYLSDDRCALLPLRHDAVLVVHPCGLLDALCHLFECLWQRAIPLDLPTTSMTSRGARSAADDQRLVALLLSGLTDQAIARQLGLGHRTVQRRIAAMMADLAVRTRFQAGVQAAFRGVPPPDPTSSTPGPGN